MVTQITATKVIDGVEKSATINVDFGDSLKDAEAKFGEAVVFSNFKRTATITAQAAIRRALESKKSPEEITALMKGWKPGVSLERSVDVVGSFLGKWDSMSKEERAEIMKKLKA